MCISLQQSERYWQRAPWPSRHEGESQRQLKLYRDARKLASTLGLSVRFARRRCRRCSSRIVMTSTLVSLGSIRRLCRRCLFRMTRKAVGSQWPSASCAKSVRANGGFGKWFGLILARPSSPAQRRTPSPHRILHLCMFSEIGSE